MDNPTPRTEVDPERRQQALPRTLREVLGQLAPWLGIWAVLLVVQFLLVVLVDDLNILRITENARTGFQRFGNITAYDGLFSVLTLLFTAAGIGACALTAWLPHLRRDDRTFAIAIGLQFTLLGLEEQLQLHDLLGAGRQGEVLALTLHAAVAGVIFVKWRDRVLRVWPLILMAASALAAALLLDAAESDVRFLMYLEEWLELLGAVGLAGIALSLARQAIVDATRSRRFAQAKAPDVGA